MDQRDRLVGHERVAQQQPGDLAVAGVPGDFAVTFQPDGRLERWAGLRVPTPALYQVQNAALAVAAAGAARPWAPASRRRAAVAALLVAPGVEPVEEDAPA